MPIRYAKRVNFWMKRYENFVGLTEVKASQGKVVQMEKEFVETQELRRELQMKVHVYFYRFGPTELPPELPSYLGFSCVSLGLVLVGL